MPGNNGGKSSSIKPKYMKTRVYDKLKHYSRIKE